MSDSPQTGAHENQGTRLHRNPRVSETPVESDIFLVEPDSGAVYYLDRMSAGIWTLLQVPHARGEIHAVFRDAFPDVPPAQITADLDAALDELLARRLIVPAADTP
jgi:hypothetical protein